MSLNSELEEMHGVTYGNTVFLLSATMMQTTKSDANTMEQFCEIIKK